MTVGTPGGSESKSSRPATWWGRKIRKVDPLSGSLSNGLLQTAGWVLSRALDLAGGPMGLIGEMKERILRTFLADLLDSQKPLIGRNPYRYDRMDMDGAKELARLIKETDGLLEGFEAKTPFPKRDITIVDRPAKTDPDLKKMAASLD